MLPFQRHAYQILVRVVQVVSALLMLGIALDWALGDGSQRAMLAVLGAVVTVARLLEKRDCD